MLGVAAAGQAPLGSLWMHPPVRWDYVQSPEDGGRPKGRGAEHPIHHPYPHSGWKVTWSCWLCSHMWSWLCLWLHCF